MSSVSKSNINQKIVVFGVPLVSVLIWAKTTLDPVNLPKMVLLSAVGFSLVTFVTRELWRKGSQRLNVYVILNLLYLIWILFATFFSGTNPVQSFFGVNGRYTGTLTYISFTILALAIFLQPILEFYKKIIFGLSAAGIVNILYCGFVILTNKDPIPWRNIYGNILGTFGNPNFASSFLGIFIISSFALILARLREPKILAPMGLLCLIAFTEILDSQSRQGVLVTLLGCSALVVYKIYNSRVAVIFKVSVLIGFLVSGVLAILGMLQIGPLESIIYKTSVSIRGAYWRAGWETMLQNPIFGVGPDGFGDWYARTRDARAMIVPGQDVFTNSPHNVFIEQGANGGIVLFIIYLLTQLFIFFCGIRFIIRNKSFNFVFAASFFAWLGFTAQSLISINQIGLAIWGYVLGAVSVGVCVGSANQSEEKQILSTKVSRKNIERFDFSNHLAGAGAALGLILALPIFSAEASWRSATESKNLERIIVAADNWPQSTDRYTSGIKALYASKFESQALTLTRKGIKFNSNVARLWYFLYQFPGSTDEEKRMAVENLKKLDPNFIVK